jgi:hypothetical protein
MNKLLEDIGRIKVLMEIKIDPSKEDVIESEISEEGEETSTTTDTTTDTSSKGGYPTVKKHSDTYQTKRGKANTLDMKTKWESGVARGKANKIDNSKWESGRTMGSTGP